MKTMHVIVLGAVGCASASRVERAAESHDILAGNLEARGDYDGAAFERAAAEKQRQKAARRAHYEEFAPAPPRQ
jgi:hypothetical protein